MNRNKLLLFGGIGAAGLLAVWWYMSQQQSSTSSGPQNAVNPNAQIGVAGPLGAQGTMPDIGNLLSYNQPVGAVMSVPQATSVSTGLVGDYTTTTPGSTLY
jgi:hypothetical protein